MEQNVTVLADYDRLIQILINITKNSIQFTENGTITLRGKAGYKETIIEIEDTGIGIDPEEMENIWSRSIKRSVPNDKSIRRIWAWAFHCQTTRTASLWRNRSFK